jgi:dGTPase
MTKHSKLPPPPLGDGSTAPLNVSDPKTSGIIRDIAIVAHEFSKSQTVTLTSFKRKRDRPSDQPTPEHYSPHDYAGPWGHESYPARLFTPSLKHDGYVSAFAKDYARIVHSPSFRKLQGKTQLIPAGENYFFRTRLTHSLEVAEIATRIAHRLNNLPDLGDYKLDYDLITCAALLHDIGHPPFGHSGEEALNEKMAEHELSFEGNAQTLRLVTRLENRLGQRNPVAGVYEDPRGLNLTVGTLAGILKYDKAWQRPRGPLKGDPKIVKAYYPEERETVRLLKERLRVQGEQLYTIECQIMDFADDIAYSAYDLEDTLEASIVTPFDLPAVHEDMLGRITDDVNVQIAKRYGDRVITRKDVLRELAKVFGTILDFAHPDNYNMKRWLDRVVFVGRSHNEAQLHAKNPLLRRQFLETLIEGNIESVRADLDAQRPFMSVLRPQPDRLLTMECMKAFNYHKVIASRKLQIPHFRAKHIVKTLFDALCDDISGVLLSDIERAQLAKYKKRDDRRRMRIICDVIAGFTDREAVKLFNRLNSGNDMSVFDYV